MADLQDIIKLSQEYLNAHTNMNERFKIWNEEKKDLIKSTLDEICAELIDKNDFFKSNLYVFSNVNHCVALKAGQIIVPNSNNNQEQGFQINFLQLSNGVIWVFANQHSRDDNSKNDELELFVDLNVITKEKIVDLVYKGIERVMKTSFLFIGSE